MANLAIEKRLTNNKWFETQDNIAYYPEFEKEKIVWAETAEKIKTAIVLAGIYLSKTCFMLIEKNLKLIIAIANSLLIDWFIRQSVHKLGEKGIYASEYFMEQLPIPPITPKNQPIANQIESIISQILTLTQSEDYLQNTAKQYKVCEHENQIDQLIYKLYGLTDEEIQIVESYGTK